MKVSGYGSINSTGAAGKAKAANAPGGFSDLLAAAEATESSAAAATSDVAATSALGGLLALQELSEEETRRKKQVQRGNNLLDGLENIRRHLLTGALPSQVLLGLSQEMAMHQYAGDDPAINAIIEDIELRVAVEMAKIDKAMQDRRNEVI